MDNYHARFTAALIGWGSPEIQLEVMGDDELYYELLTRDTDEFETELALRVSRLCEEQLDDLCSRPGVSLFWE